MEPTALEEDSNYCFAVEVLTNINLMLDIIIKGNAELHRELQNCKQETRKTRLQLGDRQYE